MNHSAQPTHKNPAPPGRIGLYDPALEHDNCGLALIARYKGGADHTVITQALDALRRLEHRGGIGSDDGTGDGAGLTIQIPHDYFAARLGESGISLPAPGDYAMGIGFFSQDYATDLNAVTAPLTAETQPDFSAESAGVDQDALVSRIAAEEDSKSSTWNPWPSTPSARPDRRRDHAVHALCVLRPDADHPARDDNDSPDEPSSCGSARQRRTLLPVPVADDDAQGMLSTAQLDRFFTELGDERLTSAIALVHSRFSTNTFPSWQLAQPFGTIAHNGEINTVRGNRNWMQARESALASDLLQSPVADTTAGLERIFPIISAGASDSASFNSVLELMVASGRSLPQAMLMMIPEAWENNPAMSEERRAFYEYHSLLMEPWDGPACVAFTDGRLAGAVLDRNGLRPARYVMTEDTVVLASESGVVDLPEAEVTARGRLTPGRMFLVDVEAGRIISDTEIKNSLATEHPTANGSRPRPPAWPNCPPASMSATPAHRSGDGSGPSDTRRKSCVAHRPMAETGAEPWARWAATPRSRRWHPPRLLFDHFTRTSPVTNPPLDSIREDIVTSMAAGIGREGNLLCSTQPDSPISCSNGR